MMMSQTARIGHTYKGPERCDQSLKSKLESRRGTTIGVDPVGGGCIPPPAIFKNVFDEYNFFIISNLFDYNKPYALSTHNRKCANKVKMHNIWRRTQK